jgi:uncharacterized protein
MKRKHVPQRTCVSCRQARNKRELVRIVRTTEASVEIDPTGKQPGRGAYLCRTAACWRMAVDRGTLNRALKITLTSEQADELRQFMAALPEVPRESRADSSGSPEQQ